MKHLITYKLFEGREPQPLTREVKDASLFTSDEVIDIENMFLEYVDKWGMQEVKFQHDEDDDVEYPYYDINGADFQYHVGRYRNVAIDIYFLKYNYGKSMEIEKDLRDNFLPRIKNFGYDIVYMGNDWSDWKDLEDEIDEDEKREITIIITKY